MNTKNRLIEKLLKVAKKHKILTYPVLALVAVISVFNYFFSWSTGAGKRVVAVVMVLVMLVSQSYFLTSSATALVDTEETVQEQQELQEQKNNDLVDAEDDSSDTNELVEAEKTTELATEEPKELTDTSEASSEVVENSTTQVLDSTETTEASSEELADSVYTEDETVQNGEEGDVPAGDNSTSTEEPLETEQADGAAQEIKCVFFSPKNTNIGSEVVLEIVDGGYKIPDSAYQVVTEGLATFEEGGYYSCDGWYTASGGKGKKIEGQLITDVTPVNNIIALYSKRTIETYQVAIDVNGGKLDEATVTGATERIIEGVTYYDVPVGDNGVANFTIDNPTKIGYTIAGASGDGKGTATGTTLPISVSGTDYKRTVKLDWKAGSYNVRFAAEDGTTGAFEQSDIVFDGNGTFPDASDDVKKAKVGYTFVGWRTQAGAGVEAIELKPGQLIKNNTALQEYLYTQYKAGNTVTLIADYAYDEVKLNQTTVSYQYKQKEATSALIQGVYKDTEETSAGFSYTIDSIIADGTETTREGVVSSYGVFISEPSDNGILISSPEGPKKVTTTGIVVNVTITDDNADSPDKTTQVSFTIDIAKRKLVLKPESKPSKTYDGTDKCTADFSAGIPTNIDGVTVKVENAKYAGTDAGAQDVVLTLPADWLNGDSYTNYEFDTTNVTIPGEITKRRVYINTYADLGGREYVRAGEVNPKFYAEEVVDANSNNTGLLGDDKDRLDEEGFITLTTHKERNDDFLYTILEETYMIVAAADDNSNYTFTTNEQGSFKVKLESPDTRYIMPTTTTGYYGPNSTIILQSGVDYTNFRVKTSDGKVKDVGSSLELTEDNTQGNTISFQLFDEDSKAFTSFVTLNVQVDTTKPEYVRYTLDVANSGSGQGLYFPSAGGNMSFGHYYNKTLTFTIYYKDLKSRPTELKYYLSDSLGGNDGAEMSVNFASPDGDGIAAAKFEIPVGFVNGEAIDKIGTITFKAVDVAGNESDYYHLEKVDDEWAVEQVGPEVVSWSVKAGNPNEITVESGKDKYYSNCTAYLTVKDTASGLYGVTWHINDGKYEDRVSVTNSKVDTETFTININETTHPSDNGTYTVYPVITDNAGNSVSLQDRAITFKVDDEEPEVTILNKDQYDSYQQVVTIAFEAYDKLSGIQYLKIEDENGEINLSDYTVESIGKNEDGYEVFKCYMNTPKQGTYYIKAVDNAGKIYEQTIVLDKVSSEVPACPSVSFTPEANEKGWITSAEAKAVINNVSFTTDGTPVDTKYQLWKDGETSLHVTTIESDADTEVIPVEDGVYKLKLWSESATGVNCENAEEDTHTYTIQVDSVKPSIEYELQKGSDNSLVVNFTVKDDVSGVDGETIKVYNGAYPVAVTVEQAEDGSGYTGSFAITEVGTYSIEASDMAGNVALAPAFKPMSMKVNAVKNIAATSATVGARVIKGSYDIESTSISYRKFSDNTYKEAETVDNTDEFGNVTTSAVLKDLENGTNYVYKITALSTAGEVLEYVGYFKTLSDDEAGITVSGTAKYKDNRDGYITVGLFSGNSCIRAVEVDTSVSNTFSFYNVPDGCYDAIATDGVYTNNRRVVISQGRIVFPENSSVDLELSGMNTSVVITTDETPDVTADNLNSIFNDETNYTDEDKALVNDGKGTVEFRLCATLMKVSAVTAEELSVMYSAASSKDKLVGAFLDLSLYKIITDEDGNVSRTQVHELGGGAYASVTIPLGDLAGKPGLEVVRIHKNGDHYTGAYLVDQDNNPSTYTVIASQFSTYAVLYDPEEEPTTTEEIKDGTIDPSKDGNINNTTEDTGIDPDDDKTTEDADDNAEADDDENDKKDDKDDNKSNGGSSVGSLTSSGSAKTGDASPIMLLFGMMLVSLAGIVVLRKKAKE